jgi:PAS domain S-box-containing protein
MNTGPYQSWTYYARIILLAALFGLAIRLSLWFGFSVSVPGVVNQLDTREVLLILGASLLGPWGGALIGLFSSLEAQIRWLPTITHMVLGCWAGWFYYRFVFRRSTLWGMLASWLGLIVTYYFFIYALVLVVTMEWFPNLLLGTWTPESLETGMLSAVRALALEFVFTLLMTTMILLMMPERYRMPMWVRSHRRGLDPQIDPGTQGNVPRQKSKGHLAIRLMAWFFLLSLIPLVTASIFLRDHVSSALLGAEGGRQREIVRMIAGDVKRFGIQHLHEELLAHRSSSRELFVLDSVGTFLYHTESTKIGKSAVEDYTPAQVEKMLTGKIGMGLDAETQFAFGYTTIEGTSTRVVAVQGRKMVDHALIDLQEGIYTRLGVSLLVISSLAGLIIWVLVGRPMRKFADVARKVGRGDFNATVDTADLEDEISLLGETFNEMTDNLRHLHHDMELEIAQRRTAEEILREQEKQFRLLAENSTDMISRHDLEGRYLYVSPSCRTILGREPEEVIGHSSYEFIHPDDQPVVRAQHLGQSVDVLAQPVVFRVVRSDGSVIWLETMGQIVKDPDGGKPSEIHASSRDVTQRIIAELALKESQDHLRAVIMNVPVVLSAIDKEGVFILSEGKGLEALGMKSEAVLGQSVFDLFRNNPKVLTCVRRALAGDVLNEVVGVGSTIFEMYYAPRVDRSGEIIGVVGVGRDITDRKKAEDALLESEKMYKTLVEQSADPVYVVQNGRLVFVNRAWEELFGYTIAEATADGFPIVSVVAPDHRQLVEERLRRYATGDTVSPRYEMRGMRRDGSLVDLDVSIAKIDWKGRPAIQGVYRDITERHREEQTKLHLQKTESLGILAGGIAHDFNNLLQGMLGQTSLALTRIPNDSKAYDNVAKAQQAAQRAAELTRQLLAYSGKGRFNVRPLDLNVLIRENLRFFELAIPKGVTLEEDLANDLPLIEADGGQIQQVVMNLIINASEAVGEHTGRIRLRTSVQTIAPGAIDQWARATGTLTPGEFVLLEVTDNGVGMPAETLGKIFDPFFTTKVTGRGLGLSAVIGIVKGHHGGLRVESEYGRGTSFKLLFPATERKSEVKEMPMEQARSRQYKGCILVIDDEDSVREVVQDMLEDAGIRTLVASNGEQGVQLYKASRTEIQLVLLDLSMPGIGGKQAFRLLKEINPDVRVVLSSGYSETEVTDDLRGLGLAGFIQKPYHYEALKEIMSSFLPQKP